jgi:tRNA-dihydrouridine synthase
MMALPPLRLRTLEISPPLFLAPMAGITHSAFRRLCADFGGYGALCTEMLPGKRLLNEKIGANAYTRIRPEEGRVWAQLVINGSEDIPGIVARIQTMACAALDLNCGCCAPEIRHAGAGAGLFADRQRLQATLSQLRKGWDGVLTVKCRLWQTEKDWRPAFAERLKVIEDCGVDALFVHPRFFNEKLKRSARWEHLDWIAAQTRLPVIANGDIGSVQDLASRQRRHSGLAGIMIGRLAAVRPWIFRDIAAGLEPHGPAPETSVPEVDFAQVWERHFDYVLEDFPSEKRLGRLKQFAGYFALNFLHGHEFWRAAHNAADVDSMRRVTRQFLTGNPATVRTPSIATL